MDHHIDEVDQQVVLEEEIDENYEPTQKEILDYASWLGMDLDSEQELLWIAREGLKAPLPEDWKPCQTPAGEIYYFNFATGDSIWDHPCDQRFRELYQQQKAELLQRRQLGVQGQQQRQPQQQHLQSSADPAVTADDLQQMPPALSQLQIPASGPFVATRTAVEPLQLPSPTGTMSTLPSATTTSMIESPAGGLASNNTQALLAEPSSKGTLLSRAPSAGGNVVAAAAAGSADWRATADAIDQEQRRLYRQRLEEDRRLWELRLQNDVQQEQAALQSSHQQRLWSLQHQLGEQEAQALQQMKADSEQRMQAIDLQLQAQQETEVQDANQRHAARMADISSQHAILEASAAARLQQTQEQLAATAALSDAEVVAVHERAAAAVEAQVAADAAKQKQQLLQESMKKVDEEVAAEISAYKTTRRAEAFEKLAGQLDADTAAAARLIEQQTAQLQQLEAAVSQKGAMLQSLAGKADNLSSQGHRSGDVDAVVAQTTAEQLQLASIQRQLQQSQQQLTSVDAAVLARRAAVAEAEENLNVLKQTASVVEGRVATARQQLYQLEASMKSKEVELQQRQADVQVLSSRLVGLREEVARRQDQLESLDVMHKERQLSLRETAAELAKRRGELSTFESGLSDALRKKADAEYQALEDQLRKTRKSLADAIAELSARQASLSSTNSQLAASQAALQGIESTLAAKRKELEDVLAQLQAAAVQEFHDAKSRLLDEEVRLLDSERRAMQGRVLELVESERRAAVAAGRRRIEREVADQLVEEQATLQTQRQEQVKLWLNTNAATQPPSFVSPAAHGSSAHLNAFVSSSPHVRSCDKHTDKVCRTTAVGSVKSLPLDVIEHDHPSNTERPATAEAAVRQRSNSLSPAARHRSPMRPSSSPAIQPWGKNQQDQQVWVQPDSISGAQHKGEQEFVNSGDAVGTAMGADALAEAVRMQLKALARNSMPGDLADKLHHDGFPTEAKVLPSQQRHTTGHVDKADPPASSYTGLVYQAKQFIKQRRRELQQQQVSVLAAQSEWKDALAATEEQGSEDASTVQAVQQLRQLKTVLQEQVHSLNDDTRQLKALKAQVRQLESLVTLSDQQELDRQQQQRESAIPGGQTVQPQVVTQQQATQSCGVAFPQTQLKQPFGQQLQYRMLSQGLAGVTAGTPQQESSLDRVAAALQQALDAATATTNGKPVPNGKHIGSSQHRRRSAESAWPGPTLQHSQSEVGPGGHDQDDKLQGSAPSLVYFKKLRDERNLAQNVMQKHSQWLLDFRRQVAAVAGVTQQQRNSRDGGRQHLQFALGSTAGNNEQTAVEVLMPMHATLPTSGSCQPLTLDLGGQQLVISLIPKST